MFGASFLAPSSGEEASRAVLKRAAWSLRGLPHFAAVPDSEKNDPMA